ncbi:MAG TPA: hypothetical protein VHT93_16730 [Pseudolabrys sp.]|nr:hypothetical protein [Pseudolabrys sp.]
MAASDRNSVTLIQPENPALDGRQLAAPVDLTQGNASPSGAKRALVALDDLRARTGPFGVAIVAAGSTLSAAGTMWAMWAGVVYPIALMAGYCTWTASVCLAAAVSVMQKPKAPQAAVADVRIPAKPGVGEAWKLVNTFSVSDASRLLCGVEPGARVTQDSIAWARALLDAIEQGELPAVEKPRTVTSAGGRAKPNWHTEVTRDALKSWVRSRSFSPEFLAD